MNEMFEEIRQKLDELQAEVERLKAENTELHKQLAQYETADVSKTPETAVDENDDNAKLKEYVNGLAKELIKHTAENEIQVITELMEHWRDNKPAKSSLVAIKRVINSQSLSEDCLEVIYNFLVAEGNCEPGIIKKISGKTYNLAQALLRADNLSADKVEVVLDIVFNIYWNCSSDDDMAEFRNKTEQITFLCKKFEASNKYKVVEWQPSRLIVERA